MGGRVLGLVGGLVGVALVVLAFWAVIRGVLDSPSIVGSFATAAAAIVAVVIQRERESGMRLREKHREELAPLYDRLFVVFSKGLDTDDPEQAEFIFELQRNLILKGSTDVVKEWVDWLRSLPDAEKRDPHDPAILYQWEGVLRAIRNDFGHNNDALLPGDLLRVYITDFDDEAAKWKARQGELEADTTER